MEGEKKKEIKKLTEAKSLPAMHRASTAPYWCESATAPSAYPQRGKKCAENRLFQFIHAEMGWICISSKNNPEI